MSKLMSAMPENVDQQQIRQLVPINTLSDDRFLTLADSIEVREYDVGQWLFSTGDTESLNYYLLNGKIELVMGDRVADVVVAGTNTARFPIAHQFPRRLSAKAKTPISMLVVDSHALGELLEDNNKSSYDVDELEHGDDAADWMVKLLQSRVFQLIPSSSMQQVLARMEVLPVKKGLEIITQGDEGDYYYVIDQGKCAVLQQEDGGALIQVAELESGDYFGEEALLSGSPRSSTVTMLSDGVLRRLSKADFDELIKTPLLKDVDYSTALSQVASGAVWLDVRTNEAYSQGHLANAINLPLASLRYQAASLAPNRDYIVYCDNSTLSTTAAYLLVDRGLNVVNLLGGWSEIPEDKKRQADDIPDMAPAVKANPVTDDDRVVQLEAELKRLKMDAQRSQDDLSQALQDKESRLVVINNQYELAQQNIQKLTTDLSQQKHKLNDALHEQVSLEDKVEAGQHRNETFRLELDQARSNEEAGREDVKKVREELSRLFSVIDDKDAELLSLQARFNEDLSKKDILIAELDKEEKINPKVSAQAMKAGAQLIEAEQQISRMRKERDRDINVLTERISTLEQQLTDSGRAFSDASSRYDRLEADYKSRITKLEAGLTHARLEISVADDSIIQNQLQQQRDDFHHKADMLESERNQARDRLKASVEEANELRQLIEQYVDMPAVSKHVEEEFEALRTELDWVREHAEEEIARARSEAAYAQVIEPEIPVDEAAVEIERLRQEMDAVEKSLLEREKELEASINERQMMEDLLEDRDRDLDHAQQRMETLEDDVADSGEVDIHVQQPKEAIKEHWGDSISVDLRDDRLKSSSHGSFPGDGFIKGLVIGLILAVITAVAYFIFIKDMPGIQLGNIESQPVIISDLVFTEQIALTGLSDGSTESINSSC